MLEKEAAAHFMFGLNSRILAVTLFQKQISKLLRSLVYIAYCLLNNILSYR